MSIYFAARSACKGMDRQKATPEELKKFQNLAKRAEKSSLVSQKVKRELTALSYQLGVKQWDAAADPTAVLQRAAEWKKRQFTFGKNEFQSIGKGQYKHIRGNDGTQLTEEDKARLRELAGYQIPNVNWNECFKWVITNRQSAHIYAQYPKIVQKVNRSLLAARVGTFDPLRYQEKDKDVQFLENGKYVSLLNKNPRMDKIFNSYAKKNLVEGDYTYFKGLGSVPWNSFEMRHGAEQIDLLRDNWHKQLPMLETNLTAEEATRRFGVACNGKNWVLTLACKRQTKTMDTYGSHSFMRLLIPNGDGTYDYTYGWGKFSKQYPQNFCHSMGYLFGFKKATLQYPDNNEIYTNRETLEIHHEMTPEKGAACLESFQKDILKARQNLLPFQLLMRNCSDWTVRKVRKYVGIHESQIMDIDYTDLRPKGLFGAVMALMRRSPDGFRKKFLTSVATIMPGKKSMRTSKKKLSILKTPPWNINRPFHHPGKVFQNLLKN